VDFEKGKSNSLRESLLNWAAWKRKEKQASSLEGGKRCHCIKRFCLGNASGGRRKKRGGNPPPERKERGHFAPERKVPLMMRKGKTIMGEKREIPLHVAFLEEAKGPYRMRKKGGLSLKSCKKGALSVEEKRKRKPESSVRAKKRNRPSALIRWSKKACRG